MDHPPTLPPLPPLTPIEARDIARAGLGHLGRLILPDGRFIYAHEAGDISHRHDGYNLLRHCGTLWFMTRAAALTGQPVPADLLPALARGFGWLGTRLAEPPWSTPDRPLLGLVGRGAIKLGGVGLALLALAEAAAHPGLRPLLAPVSGQDVDDTIARLRAYALSEIDGEDFRHKRDALTGATLPFRSDYYTGEAIFGLLVTGPATPDLTRVIGALMQRRYGWAEQSHWMAYAACEAVERGVVPEALGLPYLTGLMGTILDGTAYRARRASTPIACRTEALTRVLLLAQARPDLVGHDLVGRGLIGPKLLARIRAHAAENLDLQLGWYDAGQFWKDDSDRRVQIDYIQHNATAFLHWSLLPPAA